MIALLSLFTAWGQDCSAIYTQSEWDTQMDEADRLIAEADLGRALNVLRKTQNYVPCMDSLVDKTELAKFARSMAQAFFYNQEVDEALRWGRMAAITDPELGWGDLPAAHPLITMVQEAGNPPVTGPAGKGLWPEKGKGAVFVNGKLTVTPLVHDELPHVVQVFNKNGWPVRGFWMDGAAWPDDLIGDDPSPMRVPAWFDEGTGVVTPRGKPPTPGKGKSDFPIVTTAIGGGLVVASGVLYALAGTFHAKVVCNPREKEGCPTTADELAQAQSMANWLTLGAGASAAAGIGIGVTGFVMPKKDEFPVPGLVVTGRW